MWIMEFHNHNDCSKKIISKLPINREIEKVAEIFKLVSDPTRLKIMWLLSHCELCVNDICCAIKMTPPAVSHHLRLLKQLDLIQNRREGKEIYYKISNNKKADSLHKSVDNMLDVNCKCFE